VTIALVDTSVLCEYLKVPNMYGDHAAILAAVEERIDAGERLFVPLVVVVETGNHIGQNGNGHERRKTAERFVKLIGAALEDESPFHLPESGRDELRTWLARFPDHAMTGSGLGDLAIILEFERQVERHPQRRVYIWSKDEHLAGFDTGRD
jgi:predicted nucleic acid-binding protein